MSDANRTDSVESHWNDYLREIEPDRGAATRVRRGLDRALAQRRGGLSVGEPAPPMRRAAAAIGLVKSAAMSVGFAVATLTGVHLGARALAPAELPRIAVTVPPVRETATSSESPVAVDAPVAATMAAPAITPAPPLPVSPRPATTGPTPRRGAPAVAIDARPVPSPPAADALRAEIELMDRAGEALARKADAEVLALLEQHIERFPHGGMVEERRGWIAIARCRRGVSQARALALQFAREYPRSSLLDDVDLACSQHSSTDSPRPSE